MTCEHCKKVFKPSEGFIGDAQRAFCLEALCIAAAFVEARTTVNKAIHIAGLNGIDVEYHRDVELQRSGR